MVTKIEIKHYPFNKSGVEKLSVDSDIDTINWASSWPTIYILSNKKEVYVGESYKVKNRIEQHLQNKAREALQKIHILIDKEANKSYTLDTESFLIRYMAVDGTFTLQNGNHGLVNYDYYNKKLYHQKFRENVWPKLKELQLVSKNLQEIENSDLFKFSPYTSLSPNQYDIIDAILSLFNSYMAPEKGNIVIEGLPGTGKSLLGVYLMKLLTLSSADFEDSDVETKFTAIQKYIKKIGLVIPQSALRDTLKKVFKGIPGLSQSMILSPH